MWVKEWYDEVKITSATDWCHYRAFSRNLWPQSQTSNLMRKMRKLTWKADNGGHNGWSGTLTKRKHEKRMENKSKRNRTIIKCFFSPIPKKIYWKSIEWRVIGWNEGKYFWFVVSQYRNTRTQLINLLSLPCTGFIVSGREVTYLDYNSSVTFKWYWM